MRLSGVGWLVLAVAILATGCSSEPATTDQASCLPLPRVAEKVLAAGLPSGKNLDTPVAVRAVKSKHLYFVAAKVEGAPALWAMSELDGSGLVVSLNDHAADVSQIPLAPGSKSLEGVDEAKQALSCVSD